MVLQNILGITSLRDPSTSVGTDDEQQVHLSSGDVTTDYESESDNQDNAYGSHRLKASVEDVLLETLEGIRKGADVFLRPQRLEFLASMTGDKRKPTALYIISTMEKDKMPKLDRPMKRLIEFLTQHQTDPLSVTDKFDQSPLHLAIEMKKEKMVRWMCSAHKSIHTILSICNSQKMNCIHVGIEKQVKFLDFLVNLADSDTLIAKDKKGNTPLHLAVEYKRCREGQLPLIQQIIARSDGETGRKGSAIDDLNKQHLSPYLYHIQSVQMAQNDNMAKKKRREKPEENEREKPEENEREKPEEGGREEAEESQKKRKDVNHRGRHEKGHAKGSSSRSFQDGTYPNAVQAGEHQPPSSNLCAIAEEPSSNKGIGHNMPTFRHQKTSQPPSRGGEQPEGEVPNTPVPPAAANFSKVDCDRAIRRQSIAAATDNENGAFATYDGRKSSRVVDKATVHSVGRFLKLHYLRSRSYHAVVEILYGKDTTSDLELFFDLSGHGDLTEKELESLLSKLTFEDILQYVAIPQISVEPDAVNTANIGRRRDSKPDGAGRRDLCHIFQSLRDKNVNTILRVIVNDLKMPAHSDEAIEECLNSMGVISWNWKKTDICTDVIVKVASAVHEVHLYWSGNNAVLKGWSAASGLSQLRKLKTVHLHVQQGLESSSRTIHNAKQFIDRMKEVCPDVEVLRDGPMIQRSMANISAVRTEREQLTKHEWILCMKEFRKFLFDAEKKCKGTGTEIKIEEPIKVALIDDGVDVKDLDCPLIGGRTFCTRDEEHNLSDPYYVSSTGHGTIMAKQIHLLSPRAQLYVLRLEDHRSDEAGRQITAKSATQAILAAVRKGVHIISMSWTIDPPENEKERKELEDAITEAASKDILLFCSASDKGAKQYATYPAKATPKIFTIGAATASGAADEWVGNPNEISFTFPGVKVEIDDGPDSASVMPKEASGSSVATALAAGLAALILYCAQIRVFLATDQEKEKTRRDFHALKKHENMVKAFKNIGTTEPSNHKFISVWEVFGKAVQDKEHRNAQDWIHLVAQVGSILCNKI